VKRHYAYRLALYARLLLWSKGELRLDPTEVRRMLGLLQASLTAIAAQIAVAEHLQRSESPARSAESEPSNGDATQTDLPFEEPPF